MNLDAIFISETFCRQNDTFSITNYKVIQFNRQKISRNSIRGSGGCAIALSDKLLSNHVIVDTIKGRQDGILAVKLRCTDNDALVGLLANYLPPDSYHYGKDPESYYLDNSLVYTELEDCDLLIAGGDLNSRTQDDLDYLPCVDADVSSRSNPDNEKNKHGEYFLQFLKDNRALICNGRVTPDLNDFTFVSPRGRSVPDYIYCPADHIQYCVSMQVLRVSDAINMFCLPVPFSLPDHSILVSEFDLYSCLPRSSHVNAPSALKKLPPKKNIRKINENFMSSVETIQLVNQTIDKLELFVKNQTDMNNLYVEVKSLFLSEMDKLPNLPSTNVKSHKKLSENLLPSGTKN